MRPQLAEDIWEFDTEIDTVLDLEEDAVRQTFERIL